MHMLATVHLLGLSVAHMASSVCNRFKKYALYIHKVYKDYPALRDRLAWYEVVKPGTGPDAHVQFKTAVVRGDD